MFFPPIVDNVIGSLGFSGITPGISNNAVFSIPAMCIAAPMAVSRHVISYEASDKCNFLHTHCALHFFIRQRLPHLNLQLHVDY